MTGKKQPPSWVCLPEERAEAVRQFLAGALPGHRQPNGKGVVERSIYGCIIVKCEAVEDADYLREVEYLGILSQCLQNA